MTAPVTEREPSVPTDVILVYAVALFRFAFVMTPVPVRLVAVVAVLAATFVRFEPLRTGNKPVAVVCTSWVLPLKVLPWVVTVAVVMPLTAVADREPPEIVAPFIVVAPEIAPDRAKAVSVPTDVMFV